MGGLKKDDYNIFRGNSVSDGCGLWMGGLNEGNQSILKMN